MVGGGDLGKGEWNQEKQEEVRKQVGKGIYRYGRVEGRMMWEGSGFRV